MGTKLIYFYFGFKITDFCFAIRCSHSELSTVLAGLKSVGTQVTRPVDELILENNAMTALPGQAFSPLKVVRLMLRDNKLERVAANWLAGLEDSLLEVFIVEHELRSLPEESLETMVKLEALTLKAGHLNRIPNMSNLPKLRYIAFDFLSFLYRILTKCQQKGILHLGGGHYYSLLAGTRRSFKATTSFKAT